MKLFDIIAMAIHNLWQRRLRTAMNLVGVVIGCIVLLMTAAGASGVRAAFQSLFDASEFARQIDVHSSWDSGDEPPDGTITVAGDMDEERRERIRKRMIQVWKQENDDGSRYVMTKETLDKFAKMPHVTAVVPYIHLNCHARLSTEDAAGAETIMPPGIVRPENAVPGGLTGVGPPADSVRRSLVAGQLIEEDDLTGMLIHEYLAYQLGFRSDSQLQELIGQTVTVEWKVEGKVSTMFHYFSDRVERLTPAFFLQQVEFITAFNQLLADLDKTSLTVEQKELLRNLVSTSSEQQREKDDVVFRRTFVVRGIYREGASDNLTRLFYQHILGERADMQVHRDVATELQQKDPERRSFHNAVVFVDSSRHLKEVTEKIEAEGASQFSSLHVIESINSQIDQNSWVVFGVAGAILLTAAIGISNTLIISVMERTPEFGIMKSLGAKDGELVYLMMFEGAFLGFVGAVVAVTLSWVLSFGVQILLEMYIENQISGDITGALFHFALLPVLGTFVVSVLVCVLASIAPAVRAARLDPIVAMQRT